MMKKPTHAPALPLTCRAALALTLVVASAFVAQGSGAGYRALISTDLLAHEGRHTKAQARVIVHGTRDEITALATRHHLLIAGFLGGGAAVVTANSAELSALAADPTVHHLSGDLPVWSDMSISNRSTGADQTRAGASGLLGIGSMAGVTGQGIGVAVIDSGISPHAALANRVVANVSLVTGDPIVTDPFGHGTHVAGIIAGTAVAAMSVTSLYTGGIAPGARLVNVRVLGAGGFGLTSDVVAGVEWAIAHRAQFNIRVINLSLGHPVTEPAATDPLCEAVAHAVQAGIVVVVSAGNNGRTADGRTILGGITSPGNSPYALTVGAVNTWGTADRRDDTVTTYSSRGPTAFDLTVKPDVAAPGNKIVSLEASGSYLAGSYTFLHRAGSGQNAYMQLSGTSMAAPMVSGEVALLLQATPWLSPAQIKFAVQSGATYMPDGGLMGAGAGSANFWVSRNIAAGGLLPAVGGLLTPSGVSFWDAGTLSARLYSGRGLRLLSLLDLTLVWADPSRLHFGDLNLVGLLNPLAAVAPNRLLWGQVDGWSSGQQILWGTTVYDPQGQQILWGTDQTTQDNQILWGTAMTEPDPR
jgi:serine protease AprX